MITASAPSLVFFLSGLVPQELSVDISVMRNKGLFRIRIYFVCNLVSVGYRRSNGERTQTDVFSFQASYVRLRNEQGADMAETFSRSGFPFRFYRTSTFLLSTRTHVPSSHLATNSLAFCIRSWWILMCPSASFKENGYYRRS